MIEILKYKSSDEVCLLRNRSSKPDPDVELAVADVLKNVKDRGDAAVLEYTEKFDGVKLSDYKTKQEEIDEAYKTVGEKFISDLKAAAENIRAFHEKQDRYGFEIKREDGAVVGQRVMPLSSVGIYIPGGTASYPSSVLMNAIPANIAGVERIVMMTPPGKDGKIAAPILAAAKVAKVTEIYKAGGAQAVAALAYGTESVRAVDKIVGPGNVFVATAKKMVFGVVDIDMIAGPSEILIVADKSASPEYIAADMLSQAEHDKLASAMLICDDMELALKVQSEIEKQLSKLPRRDIAEISIKDNGKIIIVGDIEQGIEIANIISPEHLELCIRDPFDGLSKVKNAGSVFLGHYSPEALGDYFAGPNHTLPTSGTARFSSPLSVDEFVKRSSFIYYTKEALGKAKDPIMRLAEKEGLDAHAKSVAVRFEADQNE